MPEKSKVVDYMIFTDASVRTSHIDPQLTYCSSAAVLVNIKDKIYTNSSEELGCRTVSYGELYAIYSGLKQLFDVFDRHNRKDKIHILVVSDSKTTVQAFNCWIKYVWNTTDWYNWKTADKKRVKNQKLYRKIIELIRTKKNVKVSFVHINSHLEKKEIPEIQEKLKSAGYKIDYKSADMIRQLNAMADHLAQNSTMENRKYHETNLDTMYLIPKKGSSFY